MQNQNQLPSLVAQFSGELESFANLMALVHNTQENMTAKVIMHLDTLQAMAITNPDILQCEPSSIRAGLKMIIKNNLSFDPADGMTYVQTRSVALEKDNAGKVTKWGKVLEVKQTANAVLSIAYQTGTICDHNDPEIQFGDKGNIIGGSFTYYVNTPFGARPKTKHFTGKDIVKWMIASHNDKSRNKDDAATKDYSNRLYSSNNGQIDEDFFKTKMVRHGLKRLGVNSNLIGKPFNGKYLNAQAAMAEVEDEARHEAVYAATDGGNGITVVEPIDNDKAATNGDFMP